MTRTALSPAVRVSIEFDPAEMRTKQSFKAECDINNILAKYVKTGAISHFKAHGGQYMNVGPMDFHEAVQLVTESQQLFRGLPAVIRKRFANDPAEFLAFIQDPANTPEAIKLGLAQPRPGIDPQTGEIITPVPEDSSPSA